ncbi:sulfurtransferase TusA family protein [Alphaproteobacteria bacterium]|nr:sulfurtransferase TusA family protein [Alphaproteobacteria bacterium]MDB0032250.1 sulfurtransferase TusA family protein [Alphaproteobacteria bacterium]
MEYYLDTKGYECPIPVLKTAKHIKRLKKNDFITVESDDPLSQYDFQNYCEENNFKIISIRTQKKIVIIKFQI